MHTHGFSQVEKLGACLAQRRELDQSTLLHQGELGTELHVISQNRVGQKVAGSNNRVDGFRHADERNPTAKTNVREI